MTDRISARLRKALKRIGDEKINHILRRANIERMEAADHIDAQDANISALVEALEIAVDQMSSDWAFIEQMCGTERASMEAEVKNGEFPAMAKARAAIAAAKETT